MDRKLEAVVILEKSKISSSQFDCILWALQYTGTTGDAAFAIVKDDHPFFIIRRPTPNRAYIVALPDAFAFLWIKMYIKTA